MPKKKMPPKKSPMNPKMASEMPKEMPKGMHKMPGGKMMSDAEMKKKYKK